MAAKPDTSKVNPQVANVVATAFVPGPMTPVKITTKQPKDMTANYQKMVVEQDAQRAATAAANALAAQQAAQVVASAPVAPPAPTGSHADWMAAAGISPSDYGYVEGIIAGEDRSWDPTVWNGGGSGAYGLGQALPASKMAPYGADYMTSVVTQLRWANAYAIGRYGSWAAAYNYHVSTGVW